MKNIIFGIVASLFLATPVFALSPPVVGRGLPNINLNNVAGPLRSNVAWSNGNDYVSGDDFTIGKAGEKWVVTGIRTWSVGNTEFLGTLFSNISLYAGTGGISEITSGNLTDGTNDDSNPNITHSVVLYPGTTLTYQGSSGADRTIWQHDFTKLDFKIDGGNKYYFAVDGTLRAGISYYWFNHASNAGLSGTTQQGSDDRWLVWPQNSLSSNPEVCNSLGPITGICNGGWDKSSDINVQVFAHRVGTKIDDCKKDGWKEFTNPSFKNQGECISSVQANVHAGKQVVSP